MEIAREVQRAALDMRKELLVIPAEFGDWFYGVMREGAFVRCGGSTAGKRVVKSMAARHAARTGETVYLGRLTLHKDIVLEVVE